MLNLETRKQNKTKQTNKRAREKRAFLFVGRISWRETDRSTISRGNRNWRRAHAFPVPLLFLHLGSSSIVHRYSPLTPFPHCWGCRLCVPHPSTQEKKCYLKPSSVATAMCHRPHTQTHSHTHSHPLTPIHSHTHTHVPMLLFTVSEWGSSLGSPGWPHTDDPFVSVFSFSPLSYKL